MGENSCSSFFQFNFLSILLFSSCLVGMLFEYICSYAIICYNHKEEKIGANFKKKKPCPWVYFFSITRSSYKKGNPNHNK